MNLENIKQCSLSEALRLYAEALETKNDIAIKTIESYILQNHSITNATKLRCALNQIDDFDSDLFSKQMKQELIQVKLCAFEIAEHLDPIKINNFGMLEAIIHKIVNRAKQDNKSSNSLIETSQGYESLHNPH